MSFSETLENLKKSISGLVSTNQEIKNTNIEKLNSIKKKIISIKESVRNITALRGQIEQAGTELREAHGKITDCETKALEQIAASQLASELYEKEKEGLTAQLRDKDKQYDVITSNYDEKLQENAKIIASLNEDLKTNIQDVTLISETTQKNINEIENHGKEIEQAITDVDTEINTIQEDLKSAEELAQQNNTAALDVVENGNAPENDLNIDQQETLNPPVVEQVVAPAPAPAPASPSPAAVEPAPAPPAAVEPAVAPPAAPAVEPVEESEREALIKDLKKKVKKEAAEVLQQGNWDIVAQVKDEAVATLRKWDEENRGNSEKGAIYNLNDPLPSDKTYMTTAHLGITNLGGGGKKRKTTRKKRKTKKTRGRKSKN